MSENESYIINLKLGLIKQQLSVYLAEDWSTVEYQLQFFDILPLRFCNVQLVHLEKRSIKKHSARSDTWKSKGENEISEKRKRKKKLATSAFPGIKIEHIGYFFVQRKTDKSENEKIHEEN